MRDVYCVGSAVLCDGVCQWWRSYVSHTEGGQVQRACGCVRTTHTIVHIA